MPFTRLRQSLIQPNGSITGSLLGTASYAITSSYAMNGGSGGGSTPVVSVASLNNQTILYNFSSSQEATITGLTLTNNNWGINVVEEWNSASIVGDQYYNSCSLLLHFSGSNGSTTIIDNSSNNFAITSSNGAAISTAQSKFGGSSIFFDGTNDYITTPSNTAFEFGSGDFTIEGWIYPTANVTNTYYTWISKTGASGYGEFYFPQRNGNLYIFFSYNGSTWGIHGVNNGYIFGALTINAWNNFAITRQGDTVRSYLNGISGSTISLPTGQSLYAASGYGVGIGANNNGSEPVSGYADEIRITKGIARYTGSSYVTQSIEFYNNSSLNQLQTKYIGSVGGLNDSNVDYGVEKLSDSSLKIRKMSDSGQPLSGSGTLSASVDRVYVNVLNYTNVSVGSSLLGQTFTAVGSTSSYALSRSVVNPYEIVVAVDGAIQSFNDAYSVTSSTINFTENIPSGSLVDIRFLTTPNVNSASYALTSSYALNGGSGGGSVSTGSIVNQTILYNFSSSQESTITGINLTGNKWGINVIEEWNSASIVGDQYYNSCSLLMHFSGSNGSTTFIDNSPSPKTVTPSGNIQISTTQSKFGGSSGYFDGTGDYLTLSSDIAFGTDTGNFTIEFWMYPISVASGILFDNRTGGSLQSVLGYFSAPGSFTFTGGIITTGVTKTSITANSWYHVACVRSGSTAYLFVDGVSSGTDSIGGSANSSNPLTIGSKYDGTTGFNGYIDDFRFTKGVARYTSSFGVPSSAFPDSTSSIQYATKYIGLVGGLNDTNVDYGVEKLSDSSLKIRKMSVSGQPLSGSGTLSASVDRVYVNVLNYENAVITGSISNAITASFAQTTPSGKSIALSFILG